MAWSDLPATAQHEMDKVLTDLRALAEEGHARAQCLLGFVIDGGRGVVQSNVEAAKWFKKQLASKFVFYLASLGSQLFVGLRHPIG
jgi:TPR repeat protein